MRQKDIRRSRATASLANGADTRFLHWLLFGLVAATITAGSIMAALLSAVF